MLGYIGFTQHDSSEQKIWGGSANISGKISLIGAEPVGIAAGVEYRRLQGRFDPDPIVQQGFSSDIPAVTTPPGELMYMNMSFFGFSDSRKSSCAVTSEAMWSSIAPVMKTMRSRSSRE
jgi:hypothetical protein